MAIALSLAKADRSTRVAPNTNISYAPQPMQFADGSFRAIAIELLISS
jgi:hypothetical protein